MIDGSMRLSTLEAWQHMAARREGQFSNQYSKTHESEPRRTKGARTAFQALLEGDLHGSVARAALVQAWSDFYKDFPEYRPPSFEKRYREQLRAESSPYRRQAR